MKKRYGLLALLLCLVLMLSACQNNSDSGTAVKKVKIDPKNPVAIEIWHYYNGPQKEAFDQLIDEFNSTVGQELGIVAEAFSQGSVSELINKVLDAAKKKVGAGEVPDVFAAYADTAYEVDKLGMVANLDEYLTSEELKAYLPSYIEEGRLDAQRHLKIFPIAKSTEIFMMNKTGWDKFAAATGASLDALKTIEGLTNTAKSYYEWTDSLTTAPNDGKAFFGRDAIANFMIIGCKQLGVEIFSVTNGKVTIQLDKSILKRLWDNYYVPYISGYFGAFGKFRSDDVKTGDLLSLVGSTSGAAYFPTKIMVNDTESYPIEAITLPAPSFQGSEACAVQQGAGMVVTKSDDKTEYASVQFLKWFTEPERNLEFSITSGYLPVTRQANTQTALDNVIAKIGKENLSKNLLQTLPVAMDMVQTHQMYTNKAFYNGTNARNILENSLADIARADREKVKQKLSNGAALQDAVAEFCTDAYYTQWYEKLWSDLNKAIQE